LQDFVFGSDGMQPLVTAMKHAQLSGIGCEALVAALPAARKGSPVPAELAAQFLLR